jgi:hypothetical protein
MFALNLLLLSTSGFSETVPTPDLESAAHMFREVHPLQFLQKDCILKL